jgi:4-amino-4-deoxy-L-arabinose transferase-like glycosyltransferase
MIWSRNAISFAIFAASLLLFAPFLGMTHLFDWDEVNFAEAAREMLVTGEFSYVQINFKPFWEKPPLFIWMQAASMWIFGVNEFAARLPNAICGAASLVVLFNIGHTLVSTRFGLLWVLVFVGSMLPQFYFRSGIIDPWFNLFIFLGIFQLIKATRTRILNRKHLLVSAIFVGLAVMTKGPTAFGLVGICSAIYFISAFKKHDWRLLDPVAYGLTVAVIGFGWFVVEVARGRGYIVQEFIDYHIRLFSKSEAGHGQPFYYHAVVLLLGCFPMSWFFVFSWFQKNEGTENQIHFKKWMTVLFWVVLVVFSVAKTKIVHYSSLTYFPMSFLAAWYIHGLMTSDRFQLKVWHRIVLGILIVALGTAFIILGKLDLVKGPLLELLKNDQLAFGNFSTHVADGPADVLIGILFLLGGLASLAMMNRRWLGIVGLFGTTLITVSALSIVIAPKMDRYTQVALFDFYEEKAEGAYLQPLAFHSYAHLFYGKRTALPPGLEDELGWLVSGKVDRPVYFVSRPQNLESTLGYFPHLKETGRKGGYIILERTDKNYPFLGSR